jgi:hypothetical protein
VNVFHVDPTPEGVNTLYVALGYLAKHKGKWFIFPLALGRKGRPLIKNNLNRASNDPDQLERWHDRSPGCACKKSGIVCVDIDAGNGKQGMKSVHAFPAREAAAPNPARALDRGGRRRFLFGLIEGGER